MCQTVSPPLTRLHLQFVCRRAITSSLRNALPQGFGHKLFVLTTPEIVRALTCPLTILLSAQPAVILMQQSCRFN
jgi:hypothetical protein